MSPFRLMIGRRFSFFEFLIATIVYQCSISCDVKLADAHSRWVCPPPRNPDTGIKTGPCGPETNVFSTTSDEPLQVRPGPFLVQWEESIHHTGAPFRIALSQEGTDNEPCVLIDHIPHFDFDAENLLPIYGNDSTYTLYSLTIDIPDVQCDSCSLHLTNPMTDKIGDDGTPTGIGCTDPLGTCFSVYHSCTLPISILGSTPRSQYICPTANPSDWPTSWNGDDGQAVNSSTMGTYRRESATWEDSFLMDVGNNYRSFNASSGTTILSCTKTDLFPVSVDTAPLTVFVPSLPPTNAPLMTSSTPEPIASTSETPPTSSLITTSDATRAHNFFQGIIELSLKFTIDVLRSTRSIL